MVMDLHNTKRMIIIMMMMMIIMMMIMMMIMQITLLTAVCATPFDRTELAELHLW